MSRSLIASIAMLSSVVCLPLSVHANEGVGPKWGTDVKTRTAVPGNTGFNAYYEPDSVQRDGDVVRVKLYASHEMGDIKVLEEHAINCDSHESAMAVVGGGKTEWQAPSKLFAGDKIYALARELCGWGPGFWKRLAD